MKFQTQSPPLANPFTWHSWTLSPLHDILWGWYLFPLLLFYVPGSGGFRDLHSPSPLVVCLLRLLAQTPWHRGLVTVTAMNSDSCGLCSELEVGWGVGSCSSALSKCRCTLAARQPLPVQLTGTMLLWV